MAEEFEESEIIFQQDSEDIEESNEISKGEHNMNNKAKRRKTKTNHDHRKINHSISRAVPVRIPENVPRKTFFRYSDSDDEDYSEEVVPPHLIVRRRLAGKMTSFSVCTGHGRTLKGRDLSEVRNSVLRMTGFLET